MVFLLLQYFVHDFDLYVIEQLVRLLAKCCFELRVQLSVLLHHGEFDWLLQTHIVRDLVLVHLVFLVSFVVFVDVEQTVL